MDGKTFECFPMDMWSEMACLLEDWAPPQYLRQVEVTPETVGVALGIMRCPESGALRNRVPLEWWELGWLFFTVLKRSTDEKNVLL